MKLICEFLSMRTGQLYASLPNQTFVVEETTIAQGLPVSRHRL